MWSRVFMDSKRASYASQPLVPLSSLQRSAKLFRVSSINVTFHGKQYRFRYLPNNSDSSCYQATKEANQKKKRERKRSKKKRERRIVFEYERGRKREAGIYTERWLEIPRSLSYTIRYLTLSGSLSPLLTPLLSTASLSVGLECTAR